MSKINWCLKKQNGLELIEPSENIAIAYLKKSEDALRAANKLEDNLDWEISSLYYTQYFAIYSIMMKIGIKSEIHSCTLEFMKEFLNNYFEEIEIDLIIKSEKARNDLQYYSDRIITKAFKLRMKNETPLLFIKCKNILSNLTQKEIFEIREKLNSFK
jgi:uncharacterized protein (UPF0332 family)